MDRLPPGLRDHYESDFHAADAAFYAGRVASTTKIEEKYWKHWTSYVQPLGLDPHLQKVPYKWRQRSITGFAARVREGWYGRRSQIRAGSVRTAITAIGQANVLDHGVNPTKAKHSEKLTPRLAQMMDGFDKEDPPTENKLQVKIDELEYIAKGKSQVGAAQQSKRYRSESLMRAI